MAKNTFLDWDQTASNNTDIGGIGIQGTNAVSNFDDALRTVMAQLRAGVDGEVVYITKSVNYTAALNDNNAFIRCSAAMTLSLTAAATLGANWHIKVVADGGDVIVDPNASELIDGAATITIKNGYAADIICNGSAFFSDKMQATVSSAAPPGYIFGLTPSINSGTPNTHIDIAVGAVASSSSPYYMLQLASSITKNASTSWSVGSGNGSLDTGSIANSQYYGYLIQRSDTGVVDVLTSLSATSPTMPANYDRRSPALFTFVRNAAVNGLPTPMPLNRSGWIKLAESIPASATPAIDFLGAITSAYDRYRIEVDQVGNVTNTVQLRMLVSTNGGGAWLSSGYLQAALVTATSVAQTGENSLAYWVLTQDIINTLGNGANGHVELTRLFGALAMESHMAGVTTGSTLRYETQSGLISGTIDSIRFLYSAGNIAALSRIRLYGMVR